MSADVSDKTSPSDNVSLNGNIYHKLHIIHVSMINVQRNANKCVLRFRATSLDGKGFGFVRVILFLSDFDRH